MLVFYETQPNQKLTDDQIREIHEAAKREIVFDEDCPEIPEELLVKAVQDRNARLSGKTVK